MSKICLCLTGKTLAHDLEIIEHYRKYIDLVELRVDCLDPDEGFLIRRFPGMAGLPVILTIRRERDGGRYTGTEGSRVSLLAEGLANAFTDRRRNFAYIDLEDYLNVPSLEDAARVFGTRIIRSYHNITGVDEDIVGKLNSLRHTGDEIVKVAVMPQSFADVVRVFRAAQQTPDLEKILVCMGSFGIPSRILAAHFGSKFSYTAATGEFIGAPGQLNPRTLAELYRFRQITEKTRIFGITGLPLTVTSSPAIFNTVFALENIDAVYVPFPADSVESFLELAERLNMPGASVTVPHKESIIPWLASVSDQVRNIGACNTIIYNREGWHGVNTDTAGFSASLLNFIGKKNLRGKKVSIIGAGGAAHAVAAEVHRLEGKALVLNRTEIRAKELASRYQFAWNMLNRTGIEHIQKYSDIIIQTTSVGMAPDNDADPLALYQFSGHEIVMDLIYEPVQTTLLRRASDAGCPTCNGSDMLIRQAELQYKYFIGREFPPQFIARIHSLVHENK
ncbi:3-dehydroquinate dehydratase [Spirochaetia bacterium]|nr:3-dehydroquinate dehydratase [Spirochaetia bacterium]